MIENLFNRDIEKLRDKYLFVDMSSKDILKYLTSHCSFVLTSGNRFIFKYEKNLPKNIKDLFQFWVDNTFLLYKKRYLSMHKKFISKMNNYDVVLAKRIIIPNEEKTNESLHLKTIDFTKQNVSRFFRLEIFNKPIDFNTTIMIDVCFNRCLFEIINDFLFSYQFEILSQDQQILLCELLSFTEIENSIAKQKIELRKQALLLRYNNVMFEVDNIFRRYENPFFIEDYIKNNNANKKALNDK